MVVGTPLRWYFTEFEMRFCHTLLINMASTMLMIGLDEAIKISAARCAAVSYRNTDYTLEKSLQVYDRLVGAEKKHGSALEHQATPMEQTQQAYRNCPERPASWEDGVTHTDIKGNMWSGNFKGFIQHRKLIPGENYVKG